jgi:death-on-curing protein
MAIRYLRLSEVLTLYQRVMEISGGEEGIRDLGALQSALAQPRMTYGGEELYPSLAEKAGVLAYSLLKNHAFVDGNKRIAHAAMEVFLVMNGYEVRARVEEQEEVMRAIVAGKMKREELVAWIEGHMMRME